jgi:hypothetical protein
VRRCDGADLPQWSAYVPYSFDRAQLVVQAGVGDWGTAGPNAGFAAWPVHGEQWTLTIPPPEQAPANLDLDSPTSPTSSSACITAPARSPRTAREPSHRTAGDAHDTHRIVPASALHPGLATIIVSLPNRTIRSRVLMVQKQDHGVVQVAFASGDVITLQARTMVGRIERAARPRPPHARAS